jgi:hypothetical protein
MAVVEVHHIAPTEYGGFSIAAEFGAIGRCIAAQTDTSRPVYVFGPDIHDEIQSWTGSNYWNRLSDIGRTNGLVSSIISSKYRGRRQLLSKIESFLWSRGLFWSDSENIIDNDLLNDIVSFPYDDMRTKIEQEYVQTRKIKKDALYYIVEYLDLAENAELDRPIIVYGGYRYCVNYATFLTIKLWDAAGRRVPLVVLTQRPINPETELNEERDYIGVADLARRAVGLFGRDEKWARQGLTLWSLALKQSERALLDRGGLADESSVVELGVELSAIEARVQEARTRIGEIALGEVLGLILASRSFLSRFPIWDEYRSGSKMPGPGRSVENARTALALLSGFATSDGVMAPDASQRVVEFADDAREDLADPTKREGCAAAAENLAAEASRSIVGSVVASAKGGIESNNRVVEGTLPGASADVLRRLGAEAYRFAADRGGGWLEMVLDLIADRPAADDAERD